MNCGLTTPEQREEIEGSISHGDLTSGIYEGGRQWTTENKGTVVERVSSTVRVEVGAGSLGGIGALDVLVGGQIAGGQVRVKTCQAYDRPDTEEADDTDDYAGGRVSHCV